MNAKRTRGQRAGLSRERVLEAALDLVGREGMGALTMRRLAAELDIEAMTIYHYVPNKDALLDGLVERVVALAAAARPEGADWRGTLLEYARSLRRTLLAHPAVAPLLATRPALTAGTMAAVEAVLATLHEAGFAPAQGLRMVYATIGLVVGQSAVVPAASGSEAPQGVDAAAHPLFAEALAAGGNGPEERFEFALTALVAGFAPAGAR
ncbi:TetR/AcrR family transcriptional regulator C-terminal domain-containing protein [Glycomyces scopariae]